MGGRERKGKREKETVIGMKREGRRA